MPRIIGLCSAYNSGACIEETLRRAAPHLDAIHVWDGAYVDEVPGSTPSSTDDTMEAASRIPGVVLHQAPPGGWRTQVEKRTAMLSSGRPGDWYLILDADTWLQNPEVLRELDYDGMDVGWVLVTSNLYREPYRTPLLLRHVEGLHYAGRHHWLYDGERRLVTSHQHMTPTYRHRSVPVRMVNRRGLYGPHRERMREAMRRKRARVSEGLFAGEQDVYGRPEALTPYPGRAGAPSSAQVATIRPVTRRPRYSLLVPFSRTWAWEPWFRLFESVDLPWSESEILAVVDHDSSSMAAGVRRELERLAPRTAGVRMRWTKERPPGERARVRERRERIIAHWRWFQSELLGEVVLGAEDDTLPELDAYRRLIQTLEDRKAFFVQGTEVGRWSNPIIPHWEVDCDESGTVLEIRTATYRGERLVPIQGGGWYCFAARSDVVLDAGLEWTANPPLGPDVRFVLEASRRGLCLGDWGVECWHFTEREALHPATTRLQRMTTRCVGGAWQNTFDRAEPYRRDPGLRFPAERSRSRLVQERTASDRYQVPTREVVMNVPQSVRVVLTRPMMSSPAGAERLLPWRLAQNLMRHGFAVEVTGTEEPTQEAPETASEAPPEPAPVVEEQKPIPKPKRVYRRRKRAAEESTDGTAG